MLIEDPAIPQVTILVVSLLQLKQKCSVTESHLQGTYRQHRVEKKQHTWFKCGSYGSDKLSLPLTASYKYTPERRQDKSGSSQR